MKKTKKKAMKVYAKVQFFTEVFDVDDYDEAHAKIQDLVDRLGSISTRIKWDDVDWTLERVLDVEEDE